MGVYEKQVVVITGCSVGGIGHALAREFAARGCLVVATARSLASVSDLQDDPGFFVQELDVSSDESVRHALSTVLERFGRIDVVVNNAGVQCVGPIAEVPLSAIEQTFNTNVFVQACVQIGLTLIKYRSLVYKHSESLLLPSIGFRIDPHLGSLRLIQAVVPHMASRKKGKIVNVGSVTALAPVPWAGAYTASKAALHALSDTLRLELRHFGIDVINVVPGAIKSNIGNSALSNYSRMPEWELFKQFEEAIRARVSLSQSTKSTPSEEFAKKTVDAVLKERPPAWFSYGHQSLVMAIMYYLPLCIRDFIIRKRFKC
ncbi:NADPH-dependent 1-acyldihydroxyacetone phosphate reductase [Phtheirospermum japonicum]|uniref:NADPH-dependent 1-acyldihydroxyacetone phosphate reductase n=1 Tax=Phtheirospermum japonicum TaxID=374723 RepID=A0A830CFU5_9LAMI|nr:NADPH-dependent 1-acyldihydroxyacetone phosphate reductase [Phtheirospermum japonicum]